MYEFFRYSFMVLSVIFILVLITSSISYAWDNNKNYNRVDNLNRLYSYDDLKITNFHNPKVFTSKTDTLFVNHIPFIFLDEIGEVSRDKYTEERTRGISEDGYVMTSISKGYLIDAGRNLKISANLRYAKLGLGLSSLALAFSSDESNMDFSSLLSIGGIVCSIIAPYFIGQAGDILSNDNFLDTIRESGMALKTYRKSYYTGMILAATGTGMLALGASNGSDGMIKLGGLLIVPGFICSYMAPSYYLGLSGTSLSKINNFSVDTNLDLQKAGQNLNRASNLQFGSVVFSILGGVLTAYGVYESKDSIIYTGGIMLGLAIICDLFSSVGVSVAGTTLKQAANTM